MGTTQDQKASGSHLAVIDSLANELRMPPDKVAGAYFEEVARLEQDARIRTFISVLAVGAVRNGLRSQRGDQATSGVTTRK